MTTEPNGEWKRLVADLYEPENRYIGRQMALEDLLSRIMVVLKSTEEVLDALLAQDSNAIAEALRVRADAREGTPAAEFLVETLTNLPHTHYLEAITEPFDRGYVGVFDRIRFRLSALGTLEG